VEKKGVLFIPETSQLRPEFGEIEDIGEPLTEEDRRLAATLHDLKASGKRIAVSYASGTSYYRDYDGQALGDEWKWLKDFRSYRISELAAYVQED
jgi:ketosteroid isomerase-like protein